MEEDDKKCPMIRICVSGWMFLLVPAYPGSPGQKAVKQLCVCVWVCGLLQLAALWSARHSTAQAAVCAECHCTTDHWHATQRSYLAGITWTPLAIHPRARQVQSCMLGSPVAVRAGVSLLGRWLASHIQQHSAWTRRSVTSDMRRRRQNTYLLNALVHATDQWTRHVTGSTCCRSVEFICCERSLNGSSSKPPNQSAKAASVSS